MRFVPPAHLCCLALGCALILLTAAFAIPGHLTWDSGTYHLMVRSFHETGGFHIQNAFGALSSPLLAVGQTMVKNGQIVSQYPEYFTLLSQPFYALFGYRGLMVLNTLAFTGICALVWRMAPWFSTERRAPLAAVSVYALATFAFPYTQYSYPHLTSTALVCTSAWLFWGAALEKDDLPRMVPAWLRGMNGRCALAGLVFAIAVGVRLDSVFAGLAIAVPFSMLRTLGWRSLLACGIGALPALLGLAWINHVKFAKFSPFSYGRASGGYTESVVAYLPVVAIFVLGLALLLFHRYRPLRPGRTGIALGLIVIGVILALAPLGQRLIHGLFQIVVDLRVRPEIFEPGLIRSPGNAVAYWGTVKKSLIESCPFLIAIFIPAVSGIARRTYGVRWLLWLVPIGFVGVYGYLAWHGSIGWSMRYLNPALPFLALLASYELLRLRARIPTRHFGFWLGVVMLWFVLVGLFFAARTHLRWQETVMLDGGLVIAALLFAFQAMSIWGSFKLSETATKALAAGLVVSLVWSSAGIFSVDFILSRAIRIHFLESARALESRIEDRAFVATFDIDKAWGLLNGANPPVIADYTLGSTQDAIELVEQVLGHRPVYWLSRPPGRDATSKIVFAELRSRKIAVVPVLQAPVDPTYRLYRLHPAGSRMPPEESQRIQ